MIGSTFIATEIPEELKELQIDDLVGLWHISLHKLVTLDFELALQGSGVNWAQGVPVVFDEAASMAIFQVNPAALQAVTESGSSLSASHPEDIALLRQFIRDNGVVNIYELTTF